VVAGIAVRWWGLGKTSLWRDEGYSVWLSQFSLTEIWRGVASDTSPPLYYFLLHGWTRLFGISEVSLRSMSAFFETLSIPLFYLIARRILQDKFAIAIAMWLYALSMFQAQYARDARFYGLLVCASLASIYSLIEFLENRSFLHFASLILSLALGLYTHNMMFFYLPGIALLWLVYPAGPSLIRRATDGFLCGIALFLLFLPWSPNLVLQAKRVGKSFWPARPTFHDLAKTINTLSGLDSDYLVQFSNHLTRRNLYPYQRFFFVGCLFLLLFCVVAGLAQAIPANRRKALAIFGFAALPVLLVFFYSQSRPPIFLNRTFIATSAAIPLVLTAAMAHLSGRRKTVLTALEVVLLACSAISLFGFFKHFQNEDWRGATAGLLGIPPEKRIIVFATNTGEVLFDYYASRSLNPAMRLPETTGLPEPISLRDDPTQRALISFKKDEALRPLWQAIKSRSYDEIDVVTSNTPIVLNELVRNSLSQNCEVLSEQEFHQITIVRWKLKDHYGNFELNSSESKNLQARSMQRGTILAGALVEEGQEDGK
jgi:4-amino-4-deoxy-L-arabinose transferase-like glycosyltransferase